MVVSTLYIQNRLNPSKINGFKGYKPLPPLSLAWMTKILCRKPVKFNLDGISVSKIYLVSTKESGSIFS